MNICANLPVSTSHLTEVHLSLVPVTCDLPLASSQRHTEPAAARGSWAAVSIRNVLPGVTQGGPAVQEGPGP